MCKALPVFMILIHICIPAISYIKSHLIINNNGPNAHKFHHFSHKAEIVILDLVDNTDLNLSHLQQ